MQFEWALTKPKMSKRLRHLTGKRTKESHFNYRIRILCEMLRIGPWTRLPLSIRWLKQEYFVSCIMLMLNYKLFYISNVTAVVSTGIRER